MSSKYINSNYRISRRNATIFILVGFLAIQNLAFQIIFKLNIPYSIDFSDVFSPMFNQIVKDEFSFLVNKGIHIIFFPKLISYPNFYLNSFDVVNLTYIYWIVTSITLFVMYLMIKQTDKRLFWTLIPISAFLYNPLTSSGYWMVGMLAWYFPMLGITSIIYLLNRKTINLKIFTSGISLAIFSTFSILIGIISWIGGFLMLLKLASKKQLENKKWILLWILSTSAVGFMYLQLTSGISEPIHFDSLFSFTGFSFIANFISSSFRLKYEILMISTGTVSIILSIIYYWYFLKKKWIKQYFPWFALLLTALCGSIITALGRANLEYHLGNEPYYSTISQLFHISLIILTGKLIIDLKTNSYKRKLIVILLILVILSQMIMLLPSYYSGWQRGEYYFDEKMDFVNCFSLNPDSHCLERYDEYGNDFLQMINYLIENELSIFGESLLKNEYEVNKKFNIIQNLPEISTVNTFESDNNKKIQQTVKYELDSELFILNGWFLTPSDSIPNSLFLLVDEIPLLENKIFQVEQNSKVQNTTRISWSIFFPSGYIDSGCHTIKLIGSNEIEKIILDNDLIICK